MSEREGNTITSSVSITHDFAEIIKTYKLSPTEIFRAGMGVKLYELGIKGYTNILLRRRYLIAKKFMKEYESNKNLLEITSLLEQLNDKVKDALEYEKRTQNEG